ncbi:MAG: hypothetical protein V4687_01050 [Bacteroidota bacterium]
MQEEEETFLVTVRINEGLEPTTITVVPEENTASAIAHDMIFKLSREKDKETLAVLSLDSDHCWQQISGDFDKDEIDAIGNAINSHYE